MREGSTNKIENWIRSSTKIKLYKIMDSLQSIFPLKYPLNQRHFFKFRWNIVRRIGLDACIISFCESFKIFDYVRTIYYKSFATSIIYQSLVETTLLAMMPLLPM